MTKNRIFQLGIASIILVGLLLTMSRIYPYSMFNISKSIAFKLDSVYTSGLINDVLQSKDVLRQAQKSDETTKIVSKTYEILDDYSWMHSLDKTHVSKAELSNLYNDIYTLKNEYTEIRVRKHSQLSRTELITLDALTKKMQTIEKLIGELISQSYITSNRLSSNLSLIHSIFSELFNFTDAYYQEHLRTRG